MFTIRWGRLRSNPSGHFLRSGRDDDGVGEEPKGQKEREVYSPIDPLFFLFPSNLIGLSAAVCGLLTHSEMDGWGDEGNLIRKGSVVHALALSAQRFKEKESKGKQRFHMIGSNRSGSSSSRRSSQKLGIGICITTSAAVFPSFSSCRQSF